MNRESLTLRTSAVFTDAMKQAAPWTSDRGLVFDANGNIRRLAPRQIARTVIYPLGAYPSGDYTLLYNGRGALQVDPRSGSVTLGGAGRAIVHVIARPNFGIQLRLTATDPYNYLRDIRLILPGFADSYLRQPFVPSFVARQRWRNVKQLQAAAAAARAAAGAATAAAVVTSDSTSVIAIDGGGPAAAGTNWIGDVDFNGGVSSQNTTAAIDTSKVMNPAPISVYQSARFGTNFFYVIGGLTPSQTYTVRLHFAEFFHTAAGQRIFSVALNGTPILTNFDIFTAAGGANIAVVKSFSATATNSGSIRIAFTTLVNNAQVNGIEIVPSLGFPSTRPVAHPNLTSDYVGFSYEKKNLYYPAFFTSANTELIQLLKKIDGSSIVRFGGNTTEENVWTPAGAGSTKGQIAPSNYTRLASFLAAANARAIIAIPIVNASATQIAGEAMVAAKTLGTHLYGFEIGNEIDNSGLLYTQMKMDVTKGISAITGAVPGATIVGPDTASDSGSTFAALMQDVGPQFNAVSTHYYIGDKTVATIGRMLAPDPGLPGQVRKLLAAVSPHNNLGSRIDEVGSFFRGGGKGVSDTFASGLWTVDLLFNAAIYGADGVNFHGGNDRVGSYTPITDNGSTGAKPPNVQQIRGEYYGMFLFSLLDNGSTILPDNWSSDPLFTTYIVRMNSGELMLVLNNKKPISVSANYNIGRPIANADQLVYRSANPTDVTGMTFGGAAIAIDGSWRPTPQPVSYAGSTITITVAPYTCTLIRIL